MKELLLLLCRYPFYERERENLSKLLGEVDDWHKFVELINNHGIIALSAYNIKAAGLETKIPADAMAFLENGYLKSLARNIWLTERWKEVSTILCNAGIKHVLLKGMALEHTFYGSKGLRQMTDNDILIDPVEALSAWNLLQNEGFSPELIKSPLHNKIMMDIGKHLPCLYKDGYAIEIHHRLEATGYRHRATGEIRQKTKGKRKKRKDKMEEIGVEEQNNIHRIPDTDYRSPIIDHRLPQSVDPFKNKVEILIGDTKAYILNGEIQLRYLINHFERHKEAGSCQLRLYADIILIDKNSTITIPDSFIQKPLQENELHYRKAAYRTTLGSIPPKQRFRFLTGDIFPSVKWMKGRYKCSTLKALLYYPLRIGKLVWLL
jgi:hypothetical protein